MSYRLNNIDISSYGATAVLTSERLAASGIFDCPKRQSPTERSWDTSVEPFVDQQDIKLEGRELSIAFAISKERNLNAFKQALISTTILTVHGINLNVLCRSEIEVLDSGAFYRVSARFWQENIVLNELVIVPSNTGRIKIDNYNLHADFGILGAAVGGFNSIGKSLDVNTTELYENTNYRDTRDLTVNCFMLGQSFSDLYFKMSQFQSLLYKEGMRELYVGEVNYSCYCKAGFKAQVVAENLIQFTLKLSTND